MLLAVALLLVGVAPAITVAAQEDPAVADGHTGSIDPGRENDEQQQYPLNYTFFPLDHSPGNQNGQARHYAEGLSEDIRLHWIVVTSEDFNFDNCEPGNTNAFGVDRGNNRSGTQTDVSLLTSYRSYTSTDDQIQIAYYKESALAGEPITIYVEDQIVAAQQNCYTNPDEKGWYRVTGMINGSTKMDTQTDYTIQAGTQWIYVCDCADRQEAREKLGPPPSADSGGEQASTPEPTATATATATPQATPSATATPHQQATATARQQTSSATPEQHRQDDSTPTASDDSTPTATGATQSTTGGGQTTAAPTTDERQAVPTTPTLAEGPGFGVLLTLLALLSATFVTLRRKK